MNAGYIGEQMEHAIIVLISAYIYVFWRYAWQNRTFQQRENCLLMPMITNILKSHDIHWKSEMTL